MKANFGDITLSQGGFGGAETWMTNFTVKGTGDVQVIKPLRAEWVRLIARGQRMLVITLLFVPPPFEDEHEAFAALGLFFSTLPKQADLILESGGNRVPYPAACLMPFEPPPRTGVSVQYPLVFQSGQPGALVRLVLDGAGNVLTDGDGNELTWN